MTKKEAYKLFEIFGTVDGGCRVCVEGIFSEFLEKFPELKEEIKSFWVSKKNKSPFDFKWSFE